MTENCKTNLKGIAEYLGVSSDMLRKQIERGTLDIPHDRYSAKSWVFDRSDVDAWRERRRAEAQAALSARKTIKGAGAHHG